MTHRNGTATKPRKRTSPAAATDASPSPSLAAASDDNGLRVRIPINNVEASPLNPRKTFDQTQLDELAASLKSHGLLQPVLVRPTYRASRGCIAIANGNFFNTARAFPGLLEDALFELVDGERRVRAARMAGLEYVDAIVRELTDREVLEIAIVSCEQRADVPLLEKAEGYRRLVDEHGVSVEELSHQLGRSVSTIRALLKLNALPKEARKAVTDGRLSFSVANLIARLPSEEARKQAAEYALREGWDGLPSFRDVKEYVEREHMIELKGAPFSVADASLLPAAGSCKSCPKRAGNNRDLFPDCRADVCTDPPCYRLKVAASQARDEEKAKAKGLAVLTGDERRAAFRYGASTIGMGGPGQWLDLDAVWSDDDGNFSVRERLKGRLDAHQALVHDPHDGKAYYVVPRKAAKDLILADLNGRAEQKADKKADRVSRVPSEYAIKERLHALVAQAVGEGLRLQLGDMTGAGRAAAHDALRLIARRHALDEIDDCLLTAKPLSRRVPELSQEERAEDEQDAILDTWLNQAPPQDLLAYALEALALEELRGYTEGSKRLAAEIAARFAPNVNQNDLRKQAVRDLTNESRARSRETKTKPRRKKAATAAAAEPEAEESEPEPVKPKLRVGDIVTSHEFPGDQGQILSISKRGGEAEECLVLLANDERGWYNPADLTAQTMEAKAG